MSVRRYTTSGPMNVIVRIVTEGFVPIIRDAPGFIAFYVVDGGNGSLVSVSIFADEAGAEASNRLAAGYIAENLASRLTLQDVIAGSVVVEAALD
ncbi:MAG: hypothetical protein M3Z19_06530 [Chloroflexota bacterium]|nr:hypothetical protein [Chloroflexota bacterium]